MVEVIPSDGNVVGLKATDKLTHEDYMTTVIPTLEAAIAEHGKIRVLFELVDFHGWTMSAAWDDLKFEMKHDKEVERCAIVGDKSWEAFMARLGKLCMDVEYFDLKEIDKAWDYVRAPK